MTPEDRLELQRLRNDVDDVYSLLGGLESRTAAGVTRLEGELRETRRTLATDRWMASVAKSAGFARLAIGNPRIQGLLASALVAIWQAEGRRIRGLDRN